MSTMPKFAARLAAPQPSTERLIVTSEPLRVARSIIDKARAVGKRPDALVVAISGIDGSGKSTLATNVESLLRAAGLRVSRITIDDFHYKQSIRFSTDRPGEHFYRNAFRWDAFFHSLVDPLRRNRRVDVVIPALDIKTDALKLRRYVFRDIDIVLLEGIFLLRRNLRTRYDLCWWVHCSFEHALSRALRRNQEGLSEAQLRKDYDTIYFPAQRYHEQVDDPMSGVDGVFLSSDTAHASGLREPFSTGSRFGRHHTSE